MLVAAPPSSSYSPNCKGPQHSSKPTSPLANESPFVGKSDFNPLQLANALRATGMADGPASELAPYLATQSGATNGRVLMIETVAGTTLALFDPEHAFPLVDRENVSADRLQDAVRIRFDSGHFDAIVQGVVQPVPRGGNSFFTALIAASSGVAGDCITDQSVEELHHFIADYINMYPDDVAQIWNWIQPELGSRTRRSQPTPSSGNVFFPQRTSADAGRWHHVAETVAGLRDDGRLTSRAAQSLMDYWLTSEGVPRLFDEAGICGMAEVYSVITASDHGGMDHREDVATLRSSPELSHLSRNQIDEVLRESRRPDGMAWFEKTAPLLNALAESGVDRASIGHFSDLEEIVSTLDASVRTPYLKELAQWRDITGYIAGLDGDALSALCRCVSMPTEDEAISDPELAVSEQDRDIYESCVFDFLSTHLDFADIPPERRGAAGINDLKEVFADRLHNVLSYIDLSDLHDLNDKFGHSSAAVFAAAVGLGGVVLGPVLQVAALVDRALPGGSILGGLPAAVSHAIEKVDGDVAAFERRAWGLGLVHVGAEPLSPVQSKGNQWQEPSAPETTHVDVLDAVYDTYMTALGKDINSLSDIVQHMNHAVFKLGGNISDANQKAVEEAIAVVGCLAELNSNRTMVVSPRIAKAINRAAPAFVNGDLSPGAAGDITDVAAHMGVLMEPNESTILNRYEIYNKSEESPRDAFGFGQEGTSWVASDDAPVANLPENVTVDLSRHTGLFYINGAPYIHTLKGFHAVRQTASYGFIELVRRFGRDDLPEHGYVFNPSHEHLNGSAVVRVMTGIFNPSTHTYDVNQKEHPRFDNRDDLYIFSRGKYLPVRYDSEQKTFVVKTNTGVVPVAFNPGSNIWELNRFGDTPPITVTMPRSDEEIARAQTLGANLGIRLTGIDNYINRLTLLETQDVGEFVVVHSTDQLFSLRMFGGYFDFGNESPHDLAQPAASEDSHVANVLRSDWRGNHVFSRREIQYEKNQALVQKKYLETAFDQVVHYLHRFGPRPA